MDIQVLGKNVEITDVIRKYIQKKTAKLDKYLPGIDDSKVEITSEQTKSPLDRFQVQITIRTKGNILRAEERAASINLAIDDATNSLVRQIDRYKSRYDKKRTTPLPAAKKINMGLKNKNRLSDLPHVVKVKRFAVKSMTVQEAIAQMELLGHDFFLFLNEDVEGLSLLYRRNDGNYGLIEPEIEID